MDETPGQQGWVWEPLKVIQRTQEAPKEEQSTQALEIFRTDSYTCAFCAGVGQKPRGAVCSVCKGKGQLTLRPPVVRCAHCKGRGEERPRTNITCTACRGTGYISIQEPLERCPECRGTGAASQSKLPCGRCRGAGVVTVRGAQDVDG